MAYIELNLNFACSETTNSFQRKKLDAYASTSVSDVERNMGTPVYKIMNTPNQEWSQRHLF